MGLQLAFQTLHTQTGRKAFPLLADKTSANDYDRMMREGAVRASQLQEARPFPPVVEDDLERSGRCREEFVSDDRRA